MMTALVRTFVRAETFSPKNVEQKCWKRLFALCRHTKMWQDERPDKAIKKLLRNKRKKF